MTSRQRLLTALDKKVPDRLPVATHHLMPSFLDGLTEDAFFTRFGFDSIRWVTAYVPDAGRGEWYDPAHTPGHLESRRICSDNWRIGETPLPDQSYPTTRYTITTPKKALSMILQSNEHTSWLSERLIKNKRDIDIIAEYATAPLCNAEEVRRQADAFGDAGIIRGAIPSFDIYGQPGCWQDAACLYGIEDLIMATYEDPDWVHAFLRILA
jgi:uroporphyrinogen decarboxylase